MQHSSLPPRAVAPAVERVDRQRRPVARVRPVRVKVFGVPDVLDVLEHACAEGDAVLAARLVEAVGD